MKFHVAARLVFIFPTLLALLARADDARLTIKVAGIERSFSQSQLLRSPQARSLKLLHDVEYPGRAITYTAVPIAELFRGLEVDPSSTILFTCLDGFSAPIASTKLLNTDANHAVAYVAVEPVDKKWPALRPRKSAASAGPFYLVWENAEKSKIGREEWPYQLTGFEMKPALPAQFPKTVPRFTNASGETAVTDAEKKRIERGFAVFTQNCFACHTLNGEGPSKVGPDLNLPLGPTDYFKSGILEKLIRNPQTIRNWPEARMPGFDAKALSEDDLAALLGYLRHMARGREALFRAKKN